MILSDRAIEEALTTGRIKIEPFPDLATQLGSVSVDFRLGSTFMVFEHSRHSFIDPRRPQSIGDAMRTIEVRLEGRSSIARLGITVHSTAAVFEPGWVGTATMELSNLGRMAVALYPGMRICAFSFEMVSSPVRVPYRAKQGNKYAGQQTPRASQLAEENQSEMALAGIGAATVA